MQIQDLDQQLTGRLAPASRKRRRRTILLGAGALALVVASIGSAAALGGRSSPSTESNEPSVTAAVPAVAAAPQAPNGQLVPKASAPAPAPVLADGTYPTYITKVDIAGAAITVDVVQLFENEAAVTAAVQDGMSANDAQYLYIYIRNQNPRLRTLPIAKDVTIEFAHPCEAAKPKARLEQLRKDTTDYPNMYFYEVTVVRDVIQQISQRLAYAAC